MTKKERVLNAINHKPVDRVPKGELCIEPRIANAILGENFPLGDCFEREVKIRERLDMDIINTGEGTVEKLGENLFRDPFGTIFEDNGVSKRIRVPMIEDIEKAYEFKAPKATITGESIRRWHEETDFFVFTQIGGPTTILDEAIPMEDYLVYCLTNTDEIGYLSEQVMEYEFERAKIFIDNGADGILLADDIAFNGGTFLPPHIMEKILFPIYKKTVRRIKEYKNIPVFMHTDGQIMSVMDNIVDCGFDGIQSIQPSAGMDIAVVKEKYGDKLCLWGNIDLDYILCFGSEEEVRENVRKTIEIANKDGGFILSSCNTLIDSIPPQNAVAMYDEANKV